MAHFVEKNGICLYLSSFTALNKKGCLLQILIFLWIYTFSNLLRKTHFLIISELLSEIVVFFTKKRIFFSELAWKCFKTTGKHSLAVCGSFWGEKQFLLIFVPFYWFAKKKLFKQIQIFLLVCSFSKLLRKTNFLSISVQLSDIVIFWTKKWSFQWISPKMLQNNRKHCIAVCGSLWGENQFLLIFSPFTGLFKNSCLHKSKFSSWFAPIQIF